MIERILKWLQFEIRGSWRGPLFELQRIGRHLVPIPPTRFAAMPKQ